MTRRQKITVTSNDRCAVYEAARENPEVLCVYLDPEEMYEHAGCTLAAIYYAHTEGELWSGVYCHIGVYTNKGLYIDCQTTLPGRFRYQFANSRVMSFLQLEAGIDEMVARFEEARKAFVGFEKGKKR